nr:hypothetical protein [Tanacetum cinerariifolium]
MCPRKLRIAFTFVGYGNLEIALIFALSTSILALETLWPRTIYSLTMKWHFSQFNTSLAFSTVDSAEEMTTGSWLFSWRKAYSRLREAAHLRHPFSASSLWMDRADSMSWRVSKKWMVGGSGSLLCIMLGFAPSDSPFSVAPSAWLAGVGFEGVGKGGSWVLTPNLVVMAKVCASGCHRSDRTSEGKDHRRYLPRTRIHARLGCSACIHRPRGILYSSRKLGCIAFEMEKRSWMVTGRLTDHLAGRMNGFWKPEELGLESSCKVLGRVGGLVPMLLEEDDSSSKRFLPAIARDSFCCRCQADFLSLQNSLSGVEGFC